MEYLDAGPVGVGRGAESKRRRWMPVVVGAVAFLVVVVALGAVVGDWGARNAEMRRLVSRIEASEQAMGDVQDAVRDAFIPYGGAGDLSEADRTAIDLRLREIAAAGRDSIAAAGDDVAAVRWLAWHHEIGAAQEAYLEHNRAWRDYLTAAADDPTEFATSQDEVNSTFAAAEEPLRAAVPRPALFSLDDRVDVIFAPPPAVNGGPTQEA